MEDPSCPLCRSWDRRVVLRGLRDRFGAQGEFSVVRCSHCHLARVAPRPGIDEIGAYYPPEYGEHSGDHEPGSFQLAQATRVRARCPKPGRVLDIGCAQGQFLRAMTAHGWSVAGVEPDPEAARKASTIAGAVVKTGMIKRGDFSPASFDVVTMWSVIEHVHDPLRVLSEARDVLSPGGHLFMVMPNFESVERHLFRSRWFALDVPRHLTHFGPKTIRSAVERVGLRVALVEHASGHDTFKYSVDLVRRPNLAPKLATTSTLPDFLQTPRLSSTAKRFLVNGFVRTADRLGRGSQLFVVATKP